MVAPALTIETTSAASVRHPTRGGNVKVVLVVQSKGGNVKVVLVCVAVSAK